MASLTPIRIIVTGDTDGAKRAVKSLEGSLDTTERRLDAFGSALTSLGRVTVFASLADGAVELTGAILPAVGALAALPSVLAATGAGVAPLVVGLHGMADAFKNTATGAKALGELAPSAQAFVRAVQSLGPAWSALQHQVQGALFAGLAEQVKSLANASLPTLRTGMVSVADGFNQIAVAASKAVQGPVFQGAMAASFQSAHLAIAELVPAVGPLVTGFARLVQVGLPFFDRFAGWVVSGLQLAGSFLSSAAGAERMRSVIDKGVTVLGQLWGIGKNVTEVLKNIFKGADSGNLLQSIQNITASLAQWSGSAQGQKDLKDLFTSLGQLAGQTAGVLPKVADAVVTLANGFQSLPQPMKDAIGQFAAWSIVTGPAISVSANFARGIKGVIDVGSDIGNVARGVRDVGSGFIEAANGLATTGGKWSDIGGKIYDTGEAALAFGGKVAKAVAGFVIDSATAAASAAATAGTIIWGWVTSAATATVAAAEMAADWIIALGPVAWIIAGVVAVVTALTVVIVENWGTIRSFTKQAWADVVQWTSDAWNWVSDKISAVVGTVAGLGSGIAKAASGMWDGIKDAFRAAINWIIRAWDGLHFKMPEIDTHIPGVGKIGGFDVGLPQIPQLAQGGVVKARPGGTLVNVAEAGSDEVVTPLPRSGVLGTTVHFNPTYQFNAPIYGIDDLQKVLDEHDEQLIQLLEAHG